jgi:hypothetical protein
MTRYRYNKFFAATGKKVKQPLLDNKQEVKKEIIEIVKPVENKEPIKEDKQTIEPVKERTQEELLRENEALKLILNDPEMFVKKKQIKRTVKVNRDESGKIISADILEEEV